MGHRGKHMISAKKGMVNLICSPLSKSQDMVRHLQVYLECLQHRLHTIQSFSQHLPPPLHQDNYPVHLGDPQCASQQNDFSRLQICAGQILRGLRICTCYQVFPMMNTMQIMRVTIHQTWAGPKTKPQSA